ncbi:SDR family NAD(P)-dependent oxidoreductase [Planosporangium sp. 12N6]|uniref:SDR family NAD(P)-dependent oxidoreductase n=1 Tax=Planosporangium spinosum TaxID=3402278 RepID=UPI003CEFE55E
MSSDLFSVRDRVVIVTGASSGLGEHFGRKLAEAGAKVVLAARRTEKLERIAAEIGDALVVPCDVTVDDDCRALVERTVERFGRVDVLVNNAGISKPNRVDDETADDFRQVVEVNLLGAYSMCRYAGLQMVAQGSGSIINVASIVGLVGLGRMPQASYAASKAGVVNLTRELAAQWARRGVRVNSIAPGFFPTEMTEGLFSSEQGEAWVAKLTPMGRSGREGELLGALLYLASDASSYVTGSVLPVDGGWTAV